MDAMSSSSVHLPYPSRVPSDRPSILLRSSKCDTNCRREYSERFEAWSPKAFRVGPEDIHACYEILSAEAPKDVAFAQAQVRRFADAQRRALQDLGIEMLPGIAIWCDVRLYLHTDRRL